MQEQYVTLKWGDIVRIHGVNLYKNSASSNTKGLVISKGFTDPNIYYQTYSKFEEVNFYRESLFQIMPTANLDTHDYVLKQKLSDEDKLTKESMLRGERDGLEANLISKAGKEIKYGSEVIFRHIESKSYLVGTMLAAVSGEGAFKIEVSEGLSSSVIFKLVSPRSFENENDKIYYNDGLKIYHPNSDSYMNFSQNQEPIALDRPEEAGEQIPRDHSLQKISEKRPLIKNPSSIRTFIMNENKSKCLWKFIQHCSFEQNKNKEKIKSHDIVFFKHTKKDSESLVSTTISQPIVSYLKQNQQDSLSYECFWELIPKKVNEFGPEDCNTFNARNIVTGRMLKYQDFQVEIKNNSKSEGKGFDNRGLINLICPENGMKLERDQINKSKEANQNDQAEAENIPEIEQEYEKKYNRNSFIAVENLAKDIFVIHKVDEELLLGAMYVISSHQPLIKFVKRLSLGLISTQNEGIEVEDQKEREKVRYQKLFSFFNENQLANVVKILKMLAGKIYNTSYEQIVSSGNTPNKEIQKILVQTGIIQILIEIVTYLYEPFKFIESNNEYSQDRAIRTQVLQIFEFAYRLFEKVVVNFEDNRLYISRWVELFLEHSKYINKPYIQECLVGILQNNPVAITKTIDKEKITKLVDNFFREAKQCLEKGQPLTTKYLKLFSTFIKCENSVIKKNQDIILEEFIKHPDNEFNFKFRVEYKSEGIDDENDQFKVKSKQVFLAMGKGPYQTFKQFFDNHKKQWNYLMTYINLLADICIDRNITAIESVSTILSLQAVAVILFDSDLTQINKQIAEAEDGLFAVRNMHEPFIRIAHYTYVDNHKFQEIKRIMRISQWHKDPDQENTLGFEDINRTKRVFEGEKQQEEERYLQSILEYIKVYIKNWAFSLNLQMLSTVLSLLKSTVILGLWKSIISFRQLAPELMLQITKIDSNLFFKGTQGKTLQKQIVEANKEELKMDRPENKLGIECKIKAIEIFRYMNELEIDIRLRYIMNFFKGLYECTENFNLYDLPLEEDILDGEIEQKDRDEVEKRNETAKEQYIKMEGKALLGNTVKKMSEDVEVILKQNVWLNKLKELTPMQYTRQEDPMKDRYIFQKDIDQCDEENYAENMNEQFSRIVLGLFELSVYENQKLLNSSLNMLRIMFEQRKDLINNFKKVIICGKGNLEEVYLTLKFMREKFQMLSSENILHYQGDADKSFPYEIKKPYDYLIKDREKRSGIVEDLFFLARTLKDGTSLKNIESLMSVDNEVFAPGQVNNFINEKEKNNELFQSLNLAEGIYKPLIEFIKIVGDNEPSANLKRLLFSVYQYLTLLCFNNLEAKQILMHEIPHVLKHLKLRVGAANFIYEVCRNNKLLVSNEQMVDEIIEKSLQCCLEMEELVAISYFLRDQVQSLDYERAKIFFALRGILLFNDQGHKRNQEMLMNKLQSFKYDRFIFQGKIKCISELNDFNLSPGETFIAYHFELFSVLVESCNMINIGKLENLHPYSYCLECLENTNRWEIRRAFRAYINRLYYVNKDKDIFLFEKFIEKEFNIINKELSDLIDLHRNRWLSEDLKIKNGIRFTYAQSQIFLVIIEILITLHEIFLKPGFIVILRRELEKDKTKSHEKSKNGELPLHDAMIKLFKNLGCLKKIYDSVKIIDPFIKEVKKLMSRQLKEFNVRYLESKSEPEEGKAKSNAEDEESKPNESVVESEKKNYSYDHSKSFFRNLSNMIKHFKTKEHLDILKEKHKNTKKEQVNTPEDELKERYIQKIFEVENEKLRRYYAKKVEKKALHYDPHLQTANSRIFKVLAKPELEENQENIELNNELNAVKTMIEDSPVFDKFKDDEFIFLINKILSLDDTSRRIYHENWSEQVPVIPVDQMFSKIFKLIMDNPNKIDDQQKIFVIKMARCYITEAVEGSQSYKLSVEKWDSNYCPSNPHLEEKQRQIEACGGSDFIISIFKENLSNRVELLNEALLLGIAYLYGGNTDCQNSILNSLTKDTDNVMLVNMKYLIKYIGDFLINVRKIKENEKKRDFAYNIVDTYDYFNTEDKMISKYFSQSKVDKYEVQIELDNEKALRRIFRFLQLFCENNNKEMKKFLSSQVNEDQQKKPNSINFIEEACILLKKIFKVMNNKLVAIPNNLLAFIGEITQVPILENQISFIKSTFFEDISYMASFFDSPTNKMHRKFNLVAEREDDPLNLLGEIYKQSVKLALGNFEGNDNIIIKEFLNKCQPNFLWLVVRDSLWALIKEKYSYMSFVVVSENDDRESMVKTFGNITIPALREIILEERKSKNFEGHLVSIIEVLIILKKIQDFATAKQKLSLKDKENPNLEDASDTKLARDFHKELLGLANEYFPSESVTQQIFSVLDTLILQIQINCENGVCEKLQNLYFPNHPVFSYLAGTTRDRIMVEVVRETSRDKLISLLNFREEVYNEIEWNFEMNFNGLTIGSRKFPITSDTCEKVRAVSTYFSYFIILMMFWTVLAEHELTTELTTYFTFYNWKSRLFIKLLCAVQLFMMLTYTFFWYRLRGELMYQNYIKEQQENAEAQSQIDPAVEEIIEQVLFSTVYEEELKNSPSYVAFPKAVMHVGAHWLGGQVRSVMKTKYIAAVVQKVSSLYNRFYEQVWLKVSTAVNDGGFGPVFFFLTISIMGNFFGVEWYTTYLFNLFIGIPSLTNVFKAIIDNIKLLFTLSCLAGLFVMVFNVLSLSTYVPVIYEDELPDESCQSILDCVLVLYTSGAINGDMDTFQPFRFSFDILYVVFMELLFQGLVGGIMIDAYTGLNEEDKEREKDKKGFCYICSMSQSDIEKLGETFKKHTERHFLWNYLYYIYCLKIKDETDYTGIEYIIKTKIDTENVTWFPSVDSADDELRTENLMNELKDKITLMIDNEAKVLTNIETSFQERQKLCKKLLKLPEIEKQQIQEGEEAPQLED